MLQKKIPSFIMLCYEQSKLSIERNHIHPSLPHCKIYEWLYWWFEPRVAWYLTWHIWNVLIYKCQIFHYNNTYFFQKHWGIPRYAHYLVIQGYMITSQWQWIYKQVWDTLYVLTLPMYRLSCYNTCGYGTHIYCKGVKPNLKSNIWYVMCLCYVCHSNIKRIKFLPVQGLRRQRVSCSWCECGGFQDGRWSQECQCLSHDQSDL